MKNTQAVPNPVMMDVMSLRAIAKRGDDSELMAHYAIETLWNEGFRMLDGETLPLFAHDGGRYLLLRSGGETVIYDSIYDAALPCNAETLMRLPAWRC